MARKKYLKIVNIRKTVKNYITVLKKNGIKVLRVILFGSYAKGKADLESDIDVAIVSSQFGKNKIKEMMLLRKLAIKVDSHIEPIPLSPADLKDIYSTLVREIRRYGKSIKV